MAHATTIEPRGEVTPEFPLGKENYCPQCYFEDGKVALRMECKGHNDDKN